MTTASRVSDSREAFEAWKLQCGCDAKSTLMDYLKTAFNRGWKAALACQGPVVTVSDLISLSANWDERADGMEAKGLGDSFGSLGNIRTGLVSAYNSASEDLTALIAKANGHDKQDP